MHVFLRLVLTLVAAGFFSIALIRLAPGFGVDERELDPGLHPGAIAALRASKDVSLQELIRQSTTAVMSGDWGTSDTFNVPVRDLIADRWATTAASAGLGLLLAWIVALLLGGPGSLTTYGDWFGTTTSFALLAIPSGLIAVTVFLAGAPVAVGIALAVFPQVHRFVRELTRNAWRQPAVLAAAARGVSRSSLYLRHVRALTARPLAAVIGTSAATAIGAAIPMEALCDSPGLGQLAFRACQARDLALLLPLVLIVTAAVQTANAFADLGKGRAAA